MMNNQSLNTTFLSIVTIALFLLSACEKSNVEIAAKQSTLVYCSEGSPDSFDPHTSTFSTALDASARQIYNRLVRFAPNSTKTIPSLAKSWQINSTGTEYTFNLRRDIPFHSTPYFEPSRNFNADDVLFSFNRQSDSTHPFHAVGGREYAYFSFQGLNNLLKKVEKIDDYTVRFHLSRPYAPFLSVLAMEFTSIMSSEYASSLIEQGNLTDIINRPIGTGPFKFVRYQRDAYIRYKRHENYWKDVQLVENLVFAITPDPALRYARVSAGECDVMSNPLPIHLQDIATKKTLKRIEQQGLNIAYWAFNTRKPPLDDVRVRRALNHAVNRQSILQAVYYGSAEVAKNPIPPGMWSYNENTPMYEYNPQLARNLLYLAGYPNGFTIDIWAFPEQRVYNPDAIKTAELIQQNLRDIGVNANIYTLEVGAFLQKVRTGEHQTALQGWIADNGDPDNFLASLLSCGAIASGQNSSFWCNEEFDKLIIQAQKTANEDMRTVLYRKAQQIFKQGAPWLTLAHTRQNLVINQRVKNLRISLTGGIFFNDVYLESSNLEQK